MDELTAYEILRVPETASAEEVAAAYQRRRREFHPDLNKGDRRWLRELDAEYAKVGDETARRAYDQDLARKRADRARTDREEQAAAEAPPVSDESAQTSPSPRPRRARARPDTKPVRDHYRYEAPRRPANRDLYSSGYSDDAPLDAEEIVNLIGVALMVFAWWFFFTEGFADFKLLWNPVAWSPVAWLCICALLPRET